MTDGNNWSQYQKLVLDKLERNEEKIKELTDKIGLMEKTIVLLKERLTIWGALAAGIPSIIVLGFELWRAFK